MYVSEEVDIFGRSDTMMKNKWKSGYTKQTRFQFRIFRFFFTDRTFPMRK